ncbi:MAG: hypothetical protein MK179_15490 [Pirellulaceae bacterium]|nr:hypothetical protein [Pirellulaceae bacterium]
MKGWKASAMAGVDLALWDLKGKVFQQPIWRLLGGRHHEAVPAYASILYWSRWS